MCVYTDPRATMDNNKTLDNFIRTFVYKDKRERSELELRKEKEEIKVY